MQRQLAACQRPDKFEPPRTVGSVALRPLPLQHRRVMAHDPIATFLGESRTFEPSAEYRAGSRVASKERYDALYRESLDDPDTFWKRETGKGGSRWVEASAGDTAATARWTKPKHAAE